MHLEITRTDTGDLLRTTQLPADDATALADLLERVITVLVPPALLEDVPELLYRLLIDRTVRVPVTGLTLDLVGYLVPDEYL